MVSEGYIFKNINIYLRQMLATNNLFKKVIFLFFKMFSDFCSPCIFSIVYETQKKTDKTSFVLKYFEFEQKKYWGLSIYI